MCKEIGGQVRQLLAQLFGVVAKLGEAEQRQTDGVGGQIFCGHDVRALVGELVEEGVRHCGVVHSADAVGNVEGCGDTEGFLVEGESGELLEETATVGVAVRGGGARVEVGVVVELGGPAPEGLDDPGEVY